MDGLVMCAKIFLLGTVAKIGSPHRVRKLQLVGQRAARLERERMAALLLTAFPLALFRFSQPLWWASWPARQPWQP